MLCPPRRCGIGQQTPPSARGVDEEAGDHHGGGPEESEAQARKPYSLPCIFFLSPFYADSLFRKSRKSATEWQPFGSGLYYVSRGKKSWYDAENFCLSREAHLTSILSSEEQNHVTSQLTQPAWIGLTDGGRGKWEWTDGSRLIAQFWSQGYPGHSKRPGDGEQGCTIIVPLSKGLNWNEVDCNQLNRWVCKGTLRAEEPQIHQTH
ncbi:hypothetical protein Chor_011830 [Crotalus horridus]